MERPSAHQPAQAPAPIVRETLGFWGFWGQLQLFARKHWFYWDSTAKNATFHTQEEVECLWQRCITIVNTNTIVIRLPYLSYDLLSHHLLINSNTIGDIHIHIHRRNL